MAEVCALLSAIVVANVYTAGSIALFAGFFVFQYRRIEISKQLLVVLIRVTADLGFVTYEAFGSLYVTERVRDRPTSISFGHLNATSSNALNI